MKFMHLSGIRLGMYSESGRRWSEERQYEVSESLKRACRKASDEQVDIVLIAGELFDHQPVTRELEEADRIFCDYPEVSFVIIAGESDRISGNSPVLSYKWSDNVHYVLSGKGEKISFPELFTEVFARSTTPEPVPFDEVFSMREPGGPATISIALLYEKGLERNKDFRCGTFSYAALGGRNSHYEVEKDRAFYSGGLEPQGMTDQGAHGYYIGEISPVTGFLTDIEFISDASASYVPLLVKIGTGTDSAQLEAILEKEILRRGASNIYRIRISGKKDPGKVFTVDSLKGRYRIAEFIDESEPQYDFESLFDDHRQDMIGYLISSFNKNSNMPDIDKKALFYGIDALIKTSGKEGEEK